VPEELERAADLGEVASMEEIEGYFTRQARVGDGELAVELVGRCGHCHVMVCCALQQPCSVYYISPPRCIACIGCSWNDTLGCVHMVGTLQWERGEEHAVARLELSAEQWAEVGDLRRRGAAAATLAAAAADVAAPLLISSDIRVGIGENPSSPPARLAIRGSWHSVINTLAAICRAFDHVCAAQSAPLGGGGGLRFGCPGCPCCPDDFLPSVRSV
jgi:hypothetical protein